MLLSIKHSIGLRYQAKVMDGLKNVASLTVIGSCPWCSLCGA